MKIISGGQTGVDRGALDAAISEGIEHGGFCPKGRTAEDGIIPCKYKLTEIPSSGYPARTKRNVHEADATIILFFSGKQGSGSRLTERACSEYGRPFMTLPIVENEGDYRARKDILTFLHMVKPRILNVAGSRESSSPGIQKRVEEIMKAVLKTLKEKEPWMHT